MKRIASMFSLALAIAIAMSIAVVSASADTSVYETSIELETYSVLLIDQSGSMKDREAVEEILGQIDREEFDKEYFFDDRFSRDPDVRGGNSDIVSALNKVVVGGFTHITIVTDGEQYPINYSNLGGYANLDITIHLVEKSEQATEFYALLASRLTASSLKVVTPEGEKVVLDDYQPPIYMIEVPVYIPSDTDSESEPDSESDFSESIKEETIIIEKTIIEKETFPWWWVLLAAVLLAALFDFIHELITRDRGGDDEVVPLPGEAVDAIKSGSKVLADFSGSMAAQQSETVKVCKEASVKKILCFGEKVKEVKVRMLRWLRAEGHTAGWEAVEYASEKDWDDIVIISDLFFNGKCFAEISTKEFKEIMVVVPENYNQDTLECLKAISKEIKVVPLKK